MKSSNAVVSMIDTSELGAVGLYMAVYAVLGLLIAAGVGILCSHFIIKSQQRFSYVTRSKKVLIYVLCVFFSQVLAFAGYRIHLAIRENSMNSRFSEEIEADWLIGNEFSNCRNKYPISDEVASMINWTNNSDFWSAEAWSSYKATSQYEYCSVLDHRINKKLYKIENRQEAEAVISNYRNTSL